MRRRDFFKVVAGSTVVWPLTARAQQPAMPVVGLLGSTTAQGYATQLEAFKQGLKDAGYVEGQNVVRSSPNKAIDETVASCRSRNTLCELYAIGNHVVVGQSDEEKQVVTATYAREVLQKKLEFFRQPSYANFKAVAGNPDIMTYGLSLSYGRESAKNAVQESCQIFAVGDVVVFGMSRTY